MAWSAAGFAVFPCREGRKEPACGNGVHDATSDPAKIDAFWTENPNYNIGCAPAIGGNSVLDVDPPQGKATLQALEADAGALPATLTITTPRGGLHYWFDGVCATSASKLGPKLDTRSTGGYVLLPPSIIAPGEYKNNPEGGSYVVRTDAAISLLPDWISASLAAERSHIVAGTDDLDLPENVGRFRRVLEQYVASGDVAVEGAGGDDRTFRLACEALDFGLSEETACSLICEIWNPACEPPWDEADLRTKLDNAANYRQNDVGAYAVKPASEAFSDYLAGAETVSAGALVKPPKFYAFDLKEQATQREPAWLIPDCIPAEGLVAVYGKPKSFKSFLVLDLCLGIAAGTETFGFKPESRAVVYAAGEGANNISRKHVPAWRMARGLTETDFPFYVIPRVPRVVLEDDFRELVKQIQTQGIRPALVVIDTMARSASGLEENSSKDVGRFVVACDYIREQLHCSVLVVHHSGKDGSKGSRGSNALEGAVDTMLEIVRHNKTSTVALYVREQRSAEEREEPFRFQGHKVGPSLVFEPCASAEYDAVVEADALITAKKIGTVLQAMDARGYEKGVSTDVLAAELGRGVNVDPKVLTKEIHKARKKQVSIAMMSDGDPLRWHLVG